jgi:ATP-dependent helicase HrpB
MMISLPVDPLLPEISAHLRNCSNLVLEAPPGAGKTTRVPPALLSLGLGEVLVLEPRRLAVRLAARRVASERGEKVGGTVGYQVRFEDVSSAATRLRFLTEGVFTRRLLADPSLSGAGVVVLDEFHERHLEADMALALLRRLQETKRPDLRIVVMSATLDAAPIAAHLGGCRILRSEGRLFDLDVRYSPVSPAPLEEQVARAVENLVREELNGDILVFLPGAREIRRAARACEPIAQRAHLLITPLYGELSAAEQDRAIAPAERRKIILSTNVAESSVTIEGVTAVIDSGLARIPAHSVWTGLPSLEVSRISKASANQRAGRAARTQPGRAIRLYPAEDFQRRPEQQLPEILRLDLSQTCLSLHGMGGLRLDELAWMDPPPHEAVAAAEGLLQRLGALDPSGELTGIGRQMLGFPLHPRLARLVVEAESRGVGREGRALAAVLSTGERLPEQHAAVGPSDLLALLDQPWKPETKRVLEQLQRTEKSAASTSAAKHSPKISEATKKGSTLSWAGHDQALLISVLAAFPDRLARVSGGSNRAAVAKKSKQKPGTQPRETRQLMLVGGRGATLSATSVVREHQLLVAVDAEHRPEHGPLVRLASAVEAEWLIDLFPERVTERRTVEWNRAAERVESISALLYDDLVVEESSSGVVDPRLAARLLAEKAWEAGIERFTDPEELQGFLDRVAFAAKHTAVPEFDEADQKAALESLCSGLRGFAELRSAAGDGGFVRALEERLPGGAARLLRDVAPTFIRLPNGRRTKVHYSNDKPPWIASRLQDFFGMKETPRVGGGNVAVVLHLLAPNQRPLQTTTDLAGFWERLYPETRRQLSRRYPKHKWPEDPTKVAAEER